MEDRLREFNLDVSKILWLSAIKCRVWDQDPNKTDLKACKGYLHKELEIAKPPYILAMGNEALFATLGKSGITKYRSRVYELQLATYEEPLQVMPTLAPQAIERNPGQKMGFMADLRMFADMVNDKPPDDDRRPDIQFVKTRDDLKRCAAAIDKAEGVSFDFVSRSE